MEKMWMLIKKLAKEEEGTETVEWAILAALLLLAAAAAWGTLGSAISDRIGTLATTVQGTAP